MIQAVRGTKDMLPEEAWKWQFIEEVFRKSSAKFTYKELRTPVFEKTEVFSRSIGDATDIVNKEMYTFEDRGGETLTLRPEMTAALVRAVIQNKLVAQGATLRSWYFGSYFRYERPQKGRLREFHQYGAECIASPNPEADVEIIQLANEIFEAAGIQNYQLLLNSLGNAESRKNYRAALVEYLEAHKDSLSEDSKIRLEQNPLRILDSKDHNDIEIVKDAPVILDYLDEESSAHFERVKTLLDSSGIKYDITPTLVRGLDYYSHTVFEFRHDALGAQDSFGGGGRYDGLFEQLGAKPTPAVGFALGVERMMLILENTDSFPKINTAPDVYIVTASEDVYPVTMEIAGKLRKLGLDVQTDLLKRSMKAQFREANKSGAKYSIAIGEDEAASKKLTIKTMETGDQAECAFDEIGDFEW